MVSSRRWPRQGLFGRLFGSCSLSEQSHFSLCGSTAKLCQLAAGRVYASLQLLQCLSSDGRTLLREPLRRKALHRHSCLHSAGCGLRQLHRLLEGNRSVGDLGIICCLVLQVSLHCGGLGESQVAFPGLVLCLSEQAPHETALGTLLDGRGGNFEAPLHLLGPRLQGTHRRLRVGRPRLCLQHPEETSHRQLRLPAQDLDLLHGRGLDLLRLCSCLCGKTFLRIHLRLLGQISSCVDDPRDLLLCLLMFGFGLTEYTPRCESL